MNEAGKLAGTNRKAIQREALRDKGFAGALSMAKEIGAGVPAPDPPIAADATLPAKRVIEAEVVESAGKGTREGLPTDDEVEALIWRLAKGVGPNGVPVHPTVQRTALREMADLRFKTKERERMFRGLSGEGDQPRLPNGGERGLTERVTRGVRERIIGPDPSESD